MTKISSGATFYYKRIFPVLWFGFIAVFIVTALMSGTTAQDMMLLIVPVFLIVVGYVVMRLLIWDLVDDVFDCGDALLIRNRGEEERVALSNIMNVGSTTFMNPPRVTLRLVNAGKWGQEVSFVPAPAFRLNPFARNRVVEDLIVRVDRARRNVRSD